MSLAGGDEARRRWDGPWLLSKGHLLGSGKAELSSRRPARGQAIECDPLRCGSDQVASHGVRLAVVQATVVTLRDAFHEVSHADAIGGQRSVIFRRKEERGKARLVQKLPELVASA